MKATKLQNIKKMWNKSWIPLKNVVDLSYATFSFFSILWPSWHYLAFKIPGLHLSPLFWIKSTFKWSCGCYLSNYRNKNNLLRNLAFSATRAAFLALMTLKLKNKEICEEMTPNEPNDVKKLWNFHIFTLWPLIWTFRPSSAFYNFFETLEA